MSPGRVDCVFCRIASGEIPCARVHEDETCLAFLDINPLSEGHVLLIPKKHAVMLWDLPPEEVATMARLFGPLAQAVQQAVGADGVNILQNNGRSAGQAVFHAHFHFIPRVPGDGLGYRWPAGSYPEGRMAEVLKSITAAFRQVRS